MAITTRVGKGGALSHAELDTNFTDLRDGVALMVPAERGATGILVDSLGTPDYGWNDLLGEVFVPDPTEPTAPSMVTYVSTIRQLRFDPNDEAQLRFHMPHDYAVGTDIFIHVHWSHTSGVVTGGSVTWGFELMYAKGHAEGVFGASSITVVELQAASLDARRHMVCEAAASIAGGAANLFDTADIEPDGLVLGRVFLVANNITVSSGPAPDVFLHAVDIHHRTTNVGTKNRSPDFWG